MAIDNANQAQRTWEWITVFEEHLSAVDHQVRDPDPGVHYILAEATVNSIRSQRDTLQAQLDAWQAAHPDWRPTWPEVPHDHE